MEDAVNYLSGFVAVAVLGAVKKFTGALDTKIGQWVKPVQPVVALSVAIGAPYLAKALHLTTAVDPAQIAAAPTATIAAIAAAELWAKVQKKRK